MMIWKVGKKKSISLWKKRMIKYIVSDLDGTLIDTKNECDPSVIETLKRIKQMNIRFSLCSGRPIDSVRGMLEGWGLAPYTDDLIGCNGGEVLNLHTNERSISYTLSKEVVKGIIQEYEALGLIGTIYDRTILYVSRNSKEVEKVAKRLGLEIIETNILNMIHGPVVKEMFVLDPELMEETEDYYQKHHSKNYIGYKTAHDLFEFTHPKLTKAVGVQMIAETYGFKRDEIIAFGDTTNDIPMFEYAKYGICLENGSEDAKRSAYAIAPSIKEKGFSCFLEEHLQTSNLE